MNNIGKVVEVFSAKKGESGLPRPKVDFLKLIVDFGIQDDKFAQKDLDKTVMIVGLTSYELAKKNGINLEYGSLGENILFDFNPHDYEIGDCFRIGDSVIQITEKCTICSHLTCFDNKLPRLLRDCRGLYCKIIKGGEVFKNTLVNIQNI